MGNNVSTAGVIEGGALAIGKVVKKGAASDGVVVASDATNFLGILSGGDFNTVYPIGEHAPVVLSGRTMGLVGGTVVPGDELVADGSGDLVATASIGNYVVAIALEPGVVGDLVNVHVVRYNRHA